MLFKCLYDKYKDLIPYTIFGICTTLVNIVSYWHCVHVFRCSVMLSTVLAWILAVLFAYITNKKWVFYSKAKKTKEILMELISFVWCRLATGAVDWILMYLFVTKLNYNDMLVKIISNFIVIILNYLFSKFVIFNNK